MHRLTRVVYTLQKGTPSLCRRSGLDVLRWHNSHRCFARHPTDRQLRGLTMLAICAH
nr:MAG TPA: hypothetical protein [Caudoviricetes sp.]